MRRRFLLVAALSLVVFSLLVVSGGQTVYASSQTPPGGSSPLLYNAAPASAPIPPPPGTVISGTIFEDIAGDLLPTGQSIGDANNPGAAGVTVRLYRDTDNDGVLTIGADSSVDSDTTDANGNYSLTPDQANALYFVVVDSFTITPQASFNSGYTADDVWAEQVYGPGGTWGGALCDDGSGTPTQRSTPGACYGGRYATASDFGSAPEHQAKVNLGTTSVTDVDFGFSFNVVVNTVNTDTSSSGNRICQGCLAQFLQNANAIQGANILRFVPVEPPNVTLNNHSWWRIVQQDVIFPNIDDPYTTIDGTAYSFTDGTTPRDTNTGDGSRSAAVAGGKTVGTGPDAWEDTGDEHTLPAFNRPELELDGNALTRIFRIRANHTTIRHTSFYNADNAIVLDENTDVQYITIEGNYIGPRADGSQPNANETITQYGVVYLRVVDDSNITVRGNYFAYIDGEEDASGVRILGNGALVEDNDFYSICLSGPAGDAVATPNSDPSFATAGSTGTIRYNRIERIGGSGIDLFWAEGNLNVLIEENTIIDAGQDPTTQQDNGIRVMARNQGDQGVLIEHNIFKNVLTPHRSTGVSIVGKQNNGQWRAWPTQTRVSQNVFYHNEGVGLDLELEPSSSTPQVSPNDGIYNCSPPPNSAIPNCDMDYPVFTNVILSGETLQLEGRVGTPSSTAYDNAHVIIEVYKADNSDNDQSGDIVAGDGESDPHGEGHWYIGSCDISSLGSHGTFSCQIDVSGFRAHYSLDTGDYITATATLIAQSTPKTQPTQTLGAPQGSPLGGTVQFGSTSEFSNNVPIPKADLSLTKTVNPTSAGPNDTVTFTLTLTNSGPGSATNVEVTDTVPNGFTYVANSIGSNAGSTGATITTDDTNPASLKWTVDRLDKNESVTLTFNATVNSSGNYTNTAEVTKSDQPDPDSTPGNGDTNEDDYASATVTYEPEADLSLSKSVSPTSAGPGDAVTFTLTVTNSGPNDATNVEVTDQLPSGYTFVSSNPSQGTYNNTTGVWTVGSLANGANATLSISATVKSSGDYTNTAEVTKSDQTDPDSTPGNGNTNEDDYDTATVTYEPEADLSITKDDGVTLTTPGAVVEYTVTVRNNGPNDATGATVNDAKPTAITSWTWTCLSATGGASGCDGVTNSTTDFADTVNLPAGSTITYKVTAQIANNATGSLTNTATVTSPANVSDPAPANNTATDTDTIAQTSKGIGDTNQAFTTGQDVAIGEIITYQTTLNIPPGQVVNLKLTDIMSRGLAFVKCDSITASGTLTSTAGTLDTICATPLVSAEPPGSTAAVDQGRKVIWNFGTVTNNTGNDVTLTVQYQAVVLNSDGNHSGVNLTNNATWTWDNGTASASAPPTTIVEPDLDIAKSANPTTALPGEPITFTLTIHHTDDSETNAYDVAVTDKIPSGLTYVNGSLTAVDGPTPTSMNYDAATRTIRITWDNFDEGEVSHIRFQATLDNTANQSITNAASVAWTSLPGDVSQPQSIYNTLSTERTYDPLSPVNIYQAQDSVVIRIQLPETGFAPHRVTKIPAQQVAYDATTMTLEIPKIGVKVPIVGIPRTETGWDLTWLWDQAGWLEGTAYPTWAGNTVLTAHVYLPDGEPGPFVDLRQLMWGDRIIIHAYGEQYIYEVRKVRLVAPDDVSVLRHKDRDWVTLLTCQGYDESTQSYRWRLAVQAVLIQITPER